MWAHTIRLCFIVKREVAIVVRGRDRLTATLQEAHRARERRARVHIKLTTEPGTATAVSFNVV